MRNFFRRTFFFASGRHGRSGSGYDWGVEPDEIFMDAAVSSPDPAGEMERHLEWPLGRAASLLFLAAAFIGVLYLGARGFFLQVASGADLFSRSQENRFLTRTLYAPRGILRDRADTPLVANIPSFGFLFDRTGFMSVRGDLPSLLKDLGVILQKDPEFFSEIGFPENANPRALPARIFIVRDLTRDEMLAIAPRMAMLPGIESFESYRRSYPDPYAFSHVLGFVGKVSGEDLEAQPDLGMEEAIGKSGVEGFYDRLLRGAQGKKIVETDSRGTEMNFRLTREARQGTALALALDAGLQKIAYDLLGRYTLRTHGASVVAIDPRDGAIRALVSFPGFDANRFGQGLNADEFGAVLRDPLTPLFNRAIAGEFPSGSTIKPIIAAAALEEKIIDPEKKIYDPGYLDIPNPYRPGQFSRFPDWRPHGWVNLSDAIAYSANVYFYTIGGGYRDQKGLGIGKIKEYASFFGLGSRLGLDAPGEKPGLVPDPEWKKTAEPKDPTWRIGDTYHTAIGQGGLKATPLQMAAATAAIANGGTLWRPHLMEEVNDADGNAIERYKPQAIRRELASAKNLDLVRDAMRETVLRGTARLLQDVPVEVAAKTGTAQNVPGKPPHAWVTAFAPAENPEIAIVVMVEHAGEGATVAVPITRDILRWYFTRRHE